MPDQLEKKAGAGAAEDGGSSGLPGAFPETPAAQEFGVNPIPASAGIGNPVHLQPGQSVPPPNTFTNKSVNDTATYDKESYDKSGAVTAPQLPNPVTPDEERAANGGMFGLTDKKENIIPESSLPMGAEAGTAADDAVKNSGPTVQSSGPQSTTAQLAGEVPLEPKRVPEVVKESQDAASASPEANANPEAVQSKSAVEDELKNKVPEQPATSESTLSGKAAGLAAGATAAVGTGVAYVTSSPAVQDAKSKLPVPAQETFDKVANGAANGSAKETTPIASTVPDPVQESIAEAHQSPEAAANEEAVQEKSQVESELLKKVDLEQSAGEPALTASAATATTAPAPLKATDEAPSKSEPLASAAEKDMAAAATAATASAAAPTSSKGLAAPASTQAKTPATEEVARPRIDSRDISPMSHPVNSQPTITSGVSSSATPKKSTPPAAVASSSTPTPSSPVSTKTGESGTPGTDKKSKRRSFFGRIKDKLEHRKDKA